ncbi:thiamine ABC transporter substrate-binding protein [Haloferax mediterranei ATCC 33500]|uniref:ABC transporter substrate-binding protein n=1 Tax=Haloferax mediterranei (strain ATCC 33500 / DSM 1411 / JCM 8866 / NBRC 14739 / NCIMB 2177 / R-4) TaxID=523841 RepID=I3R0K5_HALMT|nr:thiamine ABC transporter substrate-binding protein [Haloferax mediterranei]AFK17765.2 thiamine-binding periplasmic protein precursor-like protein [Haloferax mediterranei ATCC 33500]AHZ22803.1 ABC transporter substrate-binding protein [Haloferax mediterranei ATCC 33500]EMA02963.1 thiamine-binding periplasmic protein precursor-like protein [Haloferax mediterranei ATCC 33500]MDX5987854.1 thiamine ABC transporter substrate-binding protein [Haloferax mediterranei ATCC 33500]QCQ74330.1 thiamine A
MRRRTFLKAAGASGASALLAGCTGTGGESTTTEQSGGATGTTTTQGTTTGGESPTLTIGTYGPFVDTVSSSPGPWLKDQFESEFDATLKWQTPDSGVNHYIERSHRGVESGADLYVGLDAQMLVRIDENLDGELFTPTEGLSHSGDVNEELEFDPKGRAVPYDTGYVSIVYNETLGDDGAFTAPKTFDELLKPEFEGTLLAQNPTSSGTGKAFLLHTIDAKGEDGYLDYWAKLKENGVRVLGGWEPAYNAYSKGEAPMVVSYSTDQVYAAESGEDMAKHQIRFLNDQGYANPEGMATFADAANPELATEFMDFMLRPEVQAEIAVRNVAFPATTTAELPADFAKYAHEPPEAVTFSYDRLKGNLSDWTDAWEQEFASK